MPCFTSKFMWHQIFFQLTVITINGSGLKGTASYLNNVKSYYVNVITAVKFQPHCQGDLDFEMFLIVFFRPSSVSSFYLLLEYYNQKDRSASIWLFMQFYHHHFHVSQTTNHALYHMHILIVLKVPCISSLSPILSILVWVTVTLSQEQCVRWLDSPLWGLWSTS